MAKKPKKIKASLILERALEKLLAGSQSFACAAIIDSELDASNEHGGQPIKSNAFQMMLRFKPAEVIETMMLTQPWWPKGDELRINAVRDAIEEAKKKGD